MLLRFSISLIGGPRPRRDDVFGLSKYQAVHGKAPAIGGLNGAQLFLQAYAHARQAMLCEGVDGAR